MPEDLRDPLVPSGIGYILVMKGPYGINVVVVDVVVKA